MVGRNDPCPCGSGKKYKKCCGREEAVDLQQVIDAELGGIMAGFAEDGFEPKEYQQLEGRNRKWQSVLSKVFDRDLIESLAFETYVFHDRIDIWQSYLARRKKAVKRQRVLDVLALWEQPLYLLAEVKGTENGILQLRDQVSGEMHQIRNSGNAKVGDRLFGIAMQSLKDGKPMLFATDSLITIPDFQRSLAEELADLLKGGVGDSLELYRPFVEFVPELDLSPFQEEVLELVSEFVERYGLQVEVIEGIAFTFLQEVPINARKPGGVAAGILQAASDFGLFEEIYVPQNVIAEELGTSTGTLAKYAGMVREFVMERVDRDLETDAERPDVMPEVVAEMGTDPRMTERGLWEMLKLSQNARSQAEIEKILQNPNKKYTPATDAERAQLLCYEAFEASGKERQRLARQAFELDPKSGDANLLMAEFVNHPMEKKLRYETAINAGYRSFDRSFDVPWGYVPNRSLLRTLFTYGAWLIEHGEYENAIKQLTELMKLNPGDHQGAKWLLLSAYTRAGRWEEAGELTEDFPLEDNTGKGMYFHYLSDLHSGVMSPAEIRAMKTDIKKRNPHLVSLLKERKAPGAFPKKLSLQPGNKDEAQLLYWLIHGIPGVEEFIG